MRMGVRDCASTCHSELIAKRGCEKQVYEGRSRGCKDTLCLLTVQDMRAAMPHDDEAGINIRSKSLFVLPNHMVF